MSALERWARRVIESTPTDEQPGGVIVPIPLIVEGRRILANIGQVLPADDRRKCATGGCIRYVPRNKVLCVDCVARARAGESEQAPGRTSLSVQPGAVEET